MSLISERNLQAKVETFAGKKIVFLKKILYVQVAIVVHIEFNAEIRTLLEIRGVDMGPNPITVRHIFRFGPFLDHVF